MLEKTKSLDRWCVKRIDQVDELGMLEHPKGHLADSMAELAVLLETSQRPSASRYGRTKPSTGVYVMVGGVVSSTAVQLLSSLTLPTASLDRSRKV